MKPMSTEDRGKFLAALYDGKTCMLNRGGLNGGPHLVRAELKNGTMKVLELVDPSTNSWAPLCVGASEWLWWHEVRVSRVWEGASTTGAVRGAEGVFVKVLDAPAGMLVRYRIEEVLGGT